ncbi:MAG: hypothetical protein ACO1OQ_04480 [Rufibacter sp.]
MKVLLKLFLFVCVACTSARQIELSNLERLSKARRNTYLVKTARATVLKHREEFYREHGEPIIETYVVKEGEHQGKRAYTVTFPYDRSKEQMSLDYAAKVYIWEDTGKAFLIHCGNTMGMYL